MAKTVILLKITGEALPIDQHRFMNVSVIQHVAQQIKTLSPHYQFGIVMGGGNIFRGAEQNGALALHSTVAHQIGMTATLMNGMVVAELFAQAGLQTTLLSAFPSAVLDKPINHQTMREIRTTEMIPIFCGGIGVPYFTTDTTAIIRALQFGSRQVWKGTTVDGIYTDDPKKNPQARCIKKLSYQEALDQKLTFMDASALYLAHEHGMTIRVFNIFEQNALEQAAASDTFGSALS